MSNTQHKGFSLMELVIVTAILAVVAAIALPRLSQRSGNAAATSLEADLGALQQAIDVYAAEHHGEFPSADGIAAQLTQYTDVWGHVRSTKDTTHIYGPYLRAIPPLPVGVRKGGTKIAAADADGVGWIYTPTSGQIRANDGVAQAEAAAGNP